MQQDNPPRNRAERRAAAHKRAPAAALVRPRQPHNPSAHPGQAIGTGAQSESGSVDCPNEAGPRPGETWEQADARIGADLTALHGRADRPPADRGKAMSHKAGGSKQARVWETLVGYYALAGLAISRVDQVDGQIIVANAEKCADAWIAAGKGNPQIMHALELITIAGPYTALVTIHVTLLFSIMDRHGVSPFAGLFARAATQEGPPSARKHGRAQTPSAVGAPEPSPLPYQPAGANAPTEAPPAPPPYQGDDFLVIPDEGLPAEIDVALREMARATGRPYQELRQEALVELAQLRMQQNGRGNHVQTPGALGAPVARE